MGRVTLRLPRLGETMETARVVGWLVAPGQPFARGDILLEVETDKTVVEVPALAAGVLRAQLVAAGDSLALDAPMAEVEVEGAADPAPVPLPVPVPPAPQPPRDPAPAPPRNGAPDDAPRPAASPAARAAARAAGIDLQALQGTGRRGRITGADVAARTGAGTGSGARPGAGVGTGLSTAVLIHGLFADARGWRGLPGRLAAAGLGVHAPDLPGHGADAVPAPGLDTAADRVAAGLPPGPLRLVGHSLGAAVAVRLALRLGARVERLVLLAPAGIGARINANFVAGMLAARTPAALRRALDLLDAGPISDAGVAAELDRLARIRATAAPLAEAVAGGGVQQIDIAADLERLGCPVAVMFGTADRILDWRDVANLPAPVAIHLVRGAGHMPHLADPGLAVALALGRDAGDRRRGA